RLLEAAASFEPGLAPFLGGCTVSSSGSLERGPRVFQSLMTNSRTLFTSGVKLKQVGSLERDYDVVLAPATWSRNEGSCCSENGSKRGVVTEKRAQFHP